MNSDNDKVILKPTDCVPWASVLASILTHGAQAVGLV